MIRRDVDRESLLVTQFDHAGIAGQLAAHVGNASFARINPVAVRAIALHDAGWTMHDGLPTLNKNQRPLDVFETPRDIQLPVWTASADRAEAVDAYMGLLVSIHSLNLAIMNSPRALATRVDSAMLALQFTMNRFQHKEIERQEKLRTQLGWPTDVPLHHGLADPKTSTMEDRLRFDVRWMQALDLISLCLLCTPPPADKTGDVHVRVGGTGSPLKLKFDRSGALRVRPWPFDQLRIEMQCPAKRVWGGRWDSLEKFREAYVAAPVEMIDLHVRA
jgi:hypothetical protein